MGERLGELPEMLERLIVWTGKISKFANKKILSDYLDDEVLQLALAKCCESVGETAGLIVKHHSAFAKNHPSLKLVEAYGFRNRLAHGYESINLEMVWDTIKIDMPELNRNPIRVQKTIISNE